MFVYSANLTGFRSFYHKASFIFGKDPLLGLIRGENQVEPELGGNGAGKTSIPDGICWIIYNKTLRGAKGPDLVNWKLKGQIVGEMHFEHKDYDCRLRRTHKPNTLEWSRNNGPYEVVSQEVLEDFIGMSYTEFLYGVAVGQFTTFFLDLDPEPKSKVFTSLLHLGKWVEASDKAKKLLEQTKLKIAETEKAIDIYTKNVGKYTEDIKAEKEKKRIFIKQQKKILETIEEKLSNNTKAHNKIIDDCEALETQIKNIEADIKAERLKERQMGDSQTDLSMEARELRGQLNDLTDQREQLEHDCKHFAEIDQCDKCGHPITKEASDNIIAYKQKELTRNFEYYDELVIKLKELEKSIDKTQHSRKLIDKNIEELEKTIRSVRAIIKAFDNDLMNLETERNKLENNKAKATDLSQFDIFIKKLEALKKEDVTNIHSNNNLLKELTREESLNDYWVKAFKDIRLWLIDKALILLEIEVNNSLEELGMRGWEITFSSEKLTKSKTISKGFHVFIKSPSDDQAKPLVAWSGGELQRLRLAVTVGLIKLIDYYRDHKFNIEFWDEPTTHLSKEGIEMLMVFFENRSKVTGKQIWLIDHTSPDFGGFDRVVNVIKTDGGSIICEEN